MWILYTLLSSLFSAVYYMSNQLANVNGNHFLIYRGFIPFLALLPFIGALNFVDDWRFYGLSILQGLLVCFTDYRNFNALKKWGAPTITALHPFGIFVVFISWLIIKPEDIISYLQNPVQTMFIILALIGIVYAVSAFKKLENTWSALIYMLPYLFIRAMCDIIGKLCMDYASPDNVNDASIVYIMITSIVIGLVHLCCYIKKGGKIKQIVAYKNLWCVLVIIILIFQMMLVNLARYTTPNPAFINALLFAYIIWILIFEKLFKGLFKNISKKNITPTQVLLLLASIVLLIISTNNDAFNMIFKLII